MPDQVWVPEAGGTFAPRNVRGVDSGDGETAYVAVYGEGGFSGGGGGSGSIGTSGTPNVSTIEDGNGAGYTAQINSDRTLSIRTDGTAPTGETVDTGGSGAIGWFGSIATACRNCATTLASILAKLGTAPAQDATVAAITTKLGTTLSVTTTNTVGATTTKAVGAGAAAAAAKGSAGTLFGVVVTQVGANPLTITDGLGGTEIAVVPANQVVGDLYLSCPRPFVNSLYVNSGTATPGITLLYA